MGKPPAFQTFAADYYMDTNHWTTHEMGMYQRLLLTQWVNGGLPNDEERLARIAGCSLKKFQKGWTIVKVKFIQNGNGFLINKKMEEIREEQRQYIESQREKGLRSAKKRWNYNVTEAVTTVKLRLQPEDNSSSSSSSSSLNKEKNKRLKHIAKVEKTPSPDVKIFIDFYYQEFKKAFSTPPHIQGGKDGAITKRLLSKISLEELKELLLRYFDSTDQFILKSGYTISLFESQINKLKIGEPAKDGMDLWLKVKEAQDERRGPGKVCLPNETAEGDIPIEPKPTG